MGDLDENGKFIPKILEQADLTAIDVEKKWVSGRVKKVVHIAKHKFMEHMIWRRNNGII